MKLAAEPPSPEDKTWLDVAREVLPGWSDEELDHALWEHTGFPAFFDGDPETCVRRQLHDYGVALTLGLTLCLWCAQHTLHPSMDCASCREKIRKARDA